MPKLVHFETTRGEIVAELHEKDAPATVANFAGLAGGTKEWTEPRSGKKVKRPFYDGLTFHRLVNGAVIQGGCPLGLGTGGPGFAIPCETAGNSGRHQRGSLSMAHAGKDTGGSQFFFCHAPQPDLDRVHTVFGHVVRGLDVLDALHAGDQMTRVWIEEVRP